MTQGAEKHRRTQCRRRTCRDARLAKTTPGRKARFAGMKTPSRLDARRRGTSMDARLGKNGPGRNARFAGKIFSTSHLRWPVFATQRPVSPSARPVPAMQGGIDAESLVRKIDKNETQIPCRSTHGMTIRDDS